MKRLDSATAFTVETALTQLGLRSLAQQFADKTVWLTEESENPLIVNAAADFWSVDFNKFVLQDFHVGLNEIALTTIAAAELRREVIRIRDNFRGNHYNKEAVVMSHVLAWLTAMQSHMTLDHG